MDSGIGERGARGVVQRQRQPLVPADPDPGLQDGHRAREGWCFDRLCAGSEQLLQPWLPARSVGRQAGAGKEVSRMEDELRHLARILAQG